MLSFMRDQGTPVDVPSTLEAVDKVEDDLDSAPPTLLLTSSLDPRADPGLLPPEGLVEGRPLPAAVAPAYKGGVRGGEGEGCFQIRLYYSVEHAQAGT